MLGGLVGGTVFSVLVDLIGNTLAFGATAAAGVAGFVWLYRHVFRPAREAATEVREAVPALKRLPEWMDHVDEQLAAGGERLRRVEERMSLAEKAAVTVAEESMRAAQNTQALVRELEVPVREGA